MKIVKTFRYDDIQGFKFGSSPIGQPSMYSHIYFVDGLLIDTGHSNMQKQVVNEITKLKLDQIFVTHHHEDHTGNIKPLQTHFDCPVYASALCIDIMKNPPPISFAQWLTWGKAEACTNMQLKENTIQTAKYNFEIIPIPGHAIDMVCLYEREKGWLFSADLWVYHYIKYFMRNESMKQQIESMSRILKLDFDVLLCAHNPQFQDGKKKLRKKLQFMEDFYGQAAKLYHQGYTINAIFKAMNLKESWSIRLLSTGGLSTLNMIKSIIRDEQAK